MRQQNGGAMTYTKVDGLEGVAFDLLSGIRTDSAAPLMTFRDYILLTCDPDELQEVEAELDPFHPERLVLISGLDGHSGAYLDYGFRSAASTEVPSVLFIHDDGDDFLHFGVMSPSFPDFDSFVDSLGEYTDHALAVFIGVVSTCTYDELVEQLSDALALPMTEYQEDDRNGNFNFLRWHSTSVKLELDDVTLQEYAAANGTSFEAVVEWADEEGRTRAIYAVLSPNQHRSGTFLYPDCPEVGMVIEIQLSWFPLERPVASFIAQVRALPSVVDVVKLPSGASG
jgi:hypothetical protein